MMRKMPCDTSEARRPQGGASRHGFVTTASWNNRMQECQFLDER